LTNDIFAPLRAPLHAAINDTIAGLEFSHSQLLGQQISMLMTHDGEQAFIPALLCAYTAETMGTPAELALTAATALALLEASAFVVDDLVIAGSGADEDGRGLIGTWGVPRTLNAADAFFALAHEALVQLQDKGLEARFVLAVADELNEACRAWAEESDARFSAEVLHTQHPSYALLAAAVRIGALQGGFQGDLDALTSGVVDNDAVAIWGALSPSAAPPFVDAATYLAGVPRT
jgi:geranylgeranyl pyrophosphate synthase